MEVELDASVDLCDERGRLDPAARGWSRRPLHHTNLTGSPGRKKRWDYWAVLAPDLALAITHADVDYLGIANVWLHRFSDGLDVLVDRPVPFARGFALLDDLEVGRVGVAARGLEIAIDERPDATRLQASCARTSNGPLEVDLTVARPPGHESLNVVIPWSDRRYQFTTKSNTRPATGRIRTGDTEIVLDEGSGAWGALDVGRGKWKYANRWNWASASGLAADGRTVGLQFGGKWTVGTGYTENALCVDGRLTKLHDELRWDYEWSHPTRPWRVRDRDGRVDAVLTPRHDRHSRFTIGVLGMEVHQVFGHWSGTVVPDDGAPVRFDGILGFAEEARNRW